MEDEKALYFYVKCVETMVYCENLESFIEDLEKYFNIEPAIIINVLEIFIRSNINNIDGHSKQNAYKTLNFFREKLKNKENMQEKTNNIIRLINCTNSKKLKNFVKIEYQNRFLDNKITLEAAKYYKNALETLRALIILDFNILINHSDFYDDETFETIADYCIENEINYLGSINIMTKENPKLLEDKLFMNRVKLVIQKMNINNVKIKKLYKKSIKNLGI